MLQQKEMPMTKGRPKAHIRDQGALNYYYLILLIYSTDSKPKFHKNKSVSIMTKLTRMLC